MGGEEKARKRAPKMARWQRIAAMDKEILDVEGAAAGTIQVATARTGLKAYPLTPAEERAHVEALSSALAAYSTSVHQGSEQADALGDRDTADIFTERV